MTDDELDAIRFDDLELGDVIPPRGPCSRVMSHRRALLAEVNRLRGKRIDEGELAEIQRTVETASASGVRSLTIDALLAHVHLQDNVIHDLMNEGAAGIAYEQGMNEGWKAAVRELVGNSTVDNPRFGDLLPPAAARAEADHLRRENERLRKALEKITKAYPAFGTRITAANEIAAEALGEPTV